MISKDDYRDEIGSKLKKSRIFNILERKCGKKDAEVLAVVNASVHYAYQRTKTILRHMGEFTLHDGDHLFRVLHLMERLLGPKTIRKLSIPELMLLVLTAFFHDIGMAPNEEEVLVWRKQWDDNPNFATDEERDAFVQFNRYCSGRPKTIDEISLLIKAGNVSSAEILKSYLITDYIRISHAERAKRIIDRDFSAKIRFRDTDLTSQFAVLCWSHNENADTLRDLEWDKLCGNDNVLCLPLVGVILRLADLLDFDAKRTPDVLFSHLNVRHPVSLKEWAKHRAVDAWQISPARIRFSATCGHPAIEASIREFCDLIDRELYACRLIAHELNLFHANERNGFELNIPDRVDRSKIGAEIDINGEPKYQYHPTSFNLSKRQVIDLLMGTKLYGSPDVALRELIQNSRDACLLRAALESKWGNSYDPSITIEYNQSETGSELIVSDNGVGMDQEIVDRFYTQVGSSYYTSPDFFRLKADVGATFIPTSRFGIGILSCFMISDTLEVESRRLQGPHKSKDAIRILVDGQESLFHIQKGSLAVPGTVTRLSMRVNPWEGLNHEEFFAAVERIFPNPPFTVKVSVNGNLHSRDQRSFRRFSPGSLADYSWKDRKHLNVLEISLDNAEAGLDGSALIAILESNGKPQKEIQLMTREVEIDGEFYKVGKQVQFSGSGFSVTTESITINDAGEVEPETGFGEWTNSKAIISLHGIQIPTNLFPRSWERKSGQPTLSWPFPAIMIVDVVGGRDLDLNSARTDILLGEKWSSFENALGVQVLTRIREQVTEEYWNELVDILEEATRRTNFGPILQQVKG